MKKLLHHQAQKITIIFPEGTDYLLSLLVMFSETLIPGGYEPESFSWTNPETERNRESGKWHLVFRIEWPSWFFGRNYKWVNRWGRILQLWCLFSEGWDWRGYCRWQFHSWTNPESEASREGNQRDNEDWTIKVSTPVFADRGFTGHVQWNYALARLLPMTMH